MSRLINQLDSFNGKIAFQTYTIQHGIEQITVLVPVKQARTFEEQFSNSKSKQKASIIEMVELLGGKVKA